MCARLRSRLFSIIAAYTLFSLPVAARANSPPIVTNVSAAQIAGTGQVRVTFDVSDADGDQVTARLICSSNNGANFDLLPVTVSGDVNRTMAPGPGKQIIWDASVDYPGRHWTQVVAKVFASDGPAFSGEMVLVSAGSFLMGSASGQSDEQPEHTVTLNAYYIDKYEVTNAEYQRFIDAGGYNTQAFWSAAGWSWRTNYSITEPQSWSSYGPGYPAFPVVGVSYYEAEAYASFVGKRLPTEAEWERAARGTNARTYPWGEGIDGSRANYSGSQDPYDGFRTPVGFYDGRLHPNPPFQTTDSPGPYGTYDQTGNVWEWVNDWYASDYYSASPSSNPTGPISGIYRVVRGGYYGISPGGNNKFTTFGRAIYTDVNGGSVTTPSLQHHGIGFRLAKIAP
jgi:sulfatase modifying factor 1